MVLDLNVALGLEDPPNECVDDDVSETIPEIENIYPKLVYNGSTWDCVDDPLNTQNVETAPVRDDDCVLIEDLGTLSLGDNTEPIIEDVNTDYVDDLDPALIDKGQPLKIEKEDSPGPDKSLHKELIGRGVLKSEDDVSDNGEATFQSNAARLNCQELEEKLSVGKLFPDLEKVYLLYCEYARFKGFSVRKGEQRYFGKSDCIRWKLFQCSCTGLPRYSSVKHKLGVYKKLVMRTDCKAKLLVAREDVGPFIVTFFETEHNHRLVRSDQTYLLRSSRSLSYAKKSVIDALKSMGIGVSTACKFMEKESGGVQNVGFTRKDAYHYVESQKKLSRVEDSDAWMLVDYFTNKSNFEPFFWWKYQLDDNGRIMNIFWRDTRCAVDFDAFGDVMSVDTTFRTNRYNMIAAPFVGINHHTNNVMFGMALMSDETTSSFIWLFETFLESMQGKQPKIIFTDQCRAMMNAIDVTFPNSKHRLCQWHVSRNCMTNFKKLNGDAEFKRLWHKCVNIVETVDDFETTWNEMMSYEIENPSWYSGMYNLKERWASVFTRGIFSAGMLATSRSESTNKALKNLLEADVSMVDFVRTSEEVQNGWRVKESNEDTWAIWNPGQMFEDNELSTHAANVYTRTIFKSFEYALTRSFNFVVSDEVRVLEDGQLELAVRIKGLGKEERRVVLNPQTNFATCSCAYWETEGLICPHIIKVFDRREISVIPEDLILRRWTKNAKKDLLSLNPTTQSPSHEWTLLDYMTFANVTMRHLYEMVTSGFKHEAARPKIVQRMKTLECEFEAIMSAFLDPAVKKEPVTPSGKKIRDPKKVPDRGFAAANAAKVQKRRKRMPKPALRSPAKKSKNSSKENAEKNPNSDKAHPSVKVEPDGLYNYNSDKAHPSVKVEPDPLYNYYRDDICCDLSLA